MNKMTIYVIHHSHTDVGFTDTQEKIRFSHIEFIREALSLIEKRPNFKWNCESCWCVQQFLAEATRAEKNKFVKFVQSGNIGLSGSYLDLAELASERVINETMDVCTEELNSLGLSYRYAMTADINGYGWRRSVATEYGDFCRAYIRTTAFIPHSVNNSLFAGARPRGILCLCGTAITTISETNSVSHRLPNLNT